MVARVRRGISIALVLLTACSRSSSPHDLTAEGKLRLVFVHQPLWGPPAAFDALLDSFRKENPEVALQTQQLPNDSDVSHQFFLTALEGGSSEIDLLVADVVWVPEFVRAGWISDLSAEFAPSVLADELLPAAADAVTLEGKTWAIPWYVDVGLLFYRSDLVPEAPRTWAQLERFARAAMKRDPQLQGYLWQGRQYEGLVCNVYEAIWGFGGESLQGGTLALDTAPAVDALAWLRHLIASGISPSSVTSAAEEQARLQFQAGRAVFMRNWPYAFAQMQKPGSPIRGKVGISPLPTQTGEPGWGTLGGWQLAVNAHASPERRAAAIRLIRILTSPAANLTFAIAYGRNPPRRLTYSDPALMREAPEIAQLLPIVERARPRPLTPYYGMLSDILQGEFSAAISGIRSPKAALQRAQAQADRLTGAAQ
jgi:multiple sugar transport system substrate-binding protein